MRPQRFLISRNFQISRHIRFCLLFTAAFTATLAGCTITKSETVKIKIAFHDQYHAHQLTNVSVIVGSDKYFFPTIIAGTTETVTLSPGVRDDKQLFLIYSLDGQQKSWDGPKITLNKGYRIEINISGLGVIQDRHCILPCSLDE